MCCSKNKKNIIGLQKENEQIKKQINDYTCTYLTRLVKGNLKTIGVASKNK